MRYIKHFLITCTCVTLVLVIVSCGGKPSRFVELLGLIPAELKNSGLIVLIDYAAFRQDNNISFFVDNDQPITNDNYFDSMIEDDRMGIGAALVYVGSFFTGNSDYVHWSFQDKYVGYNATHVDAEIQAGFPPENVVAAIGRFDPQDTRDALNWQDDWPPWAVDKYVFEDYKGLDIHSWGDGNEVHLTTRLSPPHLDFAGRARPFAVSEQNLFNAARVADVKSMINTARNTRDSLADVPEIALVADGMSTLGVYCMVIGYAQALDYEHILSRMAVDRGLTESDLNELGIDFGPRLKKFIMFGSGLGEDEKGRYTAIVIVHESAVEARENVALFTKRLERSTSYGTVWNSMITDTDIYSKGKVLLAKLYSNTTQGWMRWIEDQDTLLLYEVEPE